LNWTLGVLLAVCIAAGLFVWLAWQAAFGPGLTREQTARILVHDMKFGGRAKDKAIKYGDAILPLIQTESAGFTALNGRNSFWISEVLGEIDSDSSRVMLLDLYGRTNRLVRLIGAVGLAHQHALPDRIDEDNFLIQIVREDASQRETELAIIALGRSEDPAALPCLLNVLRKRPSGYWHHAYACQATARIGSREAVPVLRDCLKSPDFHALPDAFRALIALGDREAVPLAIARISPDLKGYNSGWIVGELKRVTGTSYGYDAEAWNRWWNSTKATWQIPEQFLAPWDEQDPVY